MMSIFSDMIENGVKVFMDDFLVFDSTRCKNSNLVLNLEKCHFMVRKGIAMGHKVSSKRPGSRKG